MRQALLEQPGWRGWLPVIIVLGIACSGCTGIARHSVGVKNLPPEVLAPSKNGKIPLNFALLQRQPPAEHIVSPHDVLGIHIPNVLTTTPESPNVYYPPEEGLVRTPAVGQPVSVSADGHLHLPLIPPLPVAGLTISQTHEVIRRAYTVDNRIVQADHFRIAVSLIRPRTERIVVIREDTGGPTPTLVRRDTVIVSRRGSAHTIDLAAPENDVLHALVATGGLPGWDAANEVWILRSEPGFVPNWQPVIGALQQAQDPAVAAQALGPQTRFIRIPLRIFPNEQIPFGPEEITLRTGDIVFLRSRETEFFYAGGLLEGGQLPLPRDYDMDVLGAIAIANGSVNGPAGRDAAGTIFRSGPGNIIPPTQALVIRRLPGGSQVKIRVNLKKALNDPRERILIQPEDVVILKYTRGELFGNMALNIVTLGYAIPNR